MVQQRSWSRRSTENFGREESCTLVNGKTYSRLALDNPTRLSHFLKSYSLRRVRLSVPESIRFRKELVPFTPVPKDLQKSNKDFKKYLAAKQRAQGHEQSSKDSKEHSAAKQPC